MQIISKSMKIITIAITIISLIVLTGCGPLKYKKVSAKDFPPDPKERIKKNMEEGRGFRIMGGDKKKRNKLLICYIEPSMACNFGYFRFYAFSISKL